MLGTVGDALDGFGFCGFDVGAGSAVDDEAGAGAYDNLSRWALK